ncbi:MAG TPA: DUF2278 family protein [Nitrospira sp.]|nr:DUF2278 family protein [Nitrospira sp.]
MPLKQYGVLVAKVIAGVREDDESSPHYQVHARAKNIDFRLAVNVKSAGGKPEVLYLAEDRFQHPMLSRLSAMAEGFNRLPPTAGGGGLDFIRANLFDPTQMQPLPHSVPGPNNDLNDRVEHYVRRAIQEADARIFAFGERWGPENGVKDKIFKFEPGNGVHDIHMNQGNDAAYRKDDGIWQDGGLLFHFPSTQQWSAVFLAFQSQSWVTDDEGHAVTQHSLVGARIVAALVNPIGPEPEAESVILVNASPDPVDLSGWALLDQNRNRQPLAGRMGRHEILTVKVKSPFKLGNSGGIITLVNSRGLKVHGVKYTKADAASEGWLVVF